MVRKLSCLFFFFMLLGSCKKSSEGKSKFDFAKVDEIVGKYLFTKEEHASSPAVGGTALFRFDNDRVIKRSGGFLSVSGSSTGVYVKSIYDTVEYISPTNVVLTSKVNIEGVNVRPFKRIITIENGLVTKKITYDDFSVSNNPDTMYYFYDTRGKLKRTVQFFKWNIIERDYFFDNSGNLQNIKGVKKSRDDGFVFYTSEETFAGYDNKPNPLKGLSLREDLLYRSFSDNNFTTYSYKSGSSEETRNFSLIYDNNGNVDFSK
jgi:hypothetical protein